MQKAHPGEKPNDFLVMISGKHSGKLPIQYFVTGLLDQEQTVNETFLAGSSLMTKVLRDLNHLISVVGNTPG